MNGEWGSDILKYFSFFCGGNLVSSLLCKGNSNGRKLSLFILQLCGKEIALISNKRAQRKRRE